jgi:hypothetical protein
LFVFYYLSHFLCCFYFACFQEEDVVCVVVEVARVEPLGSTGGARWLWIRECVPLVEQDALQCRLFTLGEVRCLPLGWDRVVVKRRLQLLDHPLRPGIKVHNKYIRKEICCSSKK